MRFLFLPKKTPNFPANLFWDGVERWRRELGEAFLDRPYVLSNDRNNDGHLDRSV